MLKIVFISSGQPSLNPRLVKEADVLADAGYDVTVLYAHWNDWGAALDKSLLAAKKWKAICIGGDPHQKSGIYFLSRLIHKFAKIVNKKSGGKSLAELAIARSGYFLIQEAKKHPADLYIGHNLGALAATVKVAKSNKKPCGFDAEDFHRNEVSDDPNDPDVILKTCLEDRYIPQVDYLSASSPSISAAYQQLFPDKNPVTLLNVFPSNPGIKQPEINYTNPVKLFWFSQNIGIKRGLENVIKALQLLKNYPFELHLLGYLSEETKDIFKELMDDQPIHIHYHEPIPADQLTAFSAQFEIGLALEPGFSRNNDWALSNKIFTYLQAGLAIVASDTTAQDELLNQFPTIGKCYQKGNPQSLADVLLYYHQHRDELLETRKAALITAREKLNWENESQKFLNQVKQTLKTG
jgi:glycosyltransferase involved in cell wall biosynthesis